MSLVDEIYDRIEDKVDTVLSDKGDSEIAQFFAGQTLFVTGTTGFLGTCLLAKLLRSCSDIKRIYVLMRGNKKYSLEDRTKRYFEHEVFNRLRKENPNFESKVTVIKGDLMSENLGLTDEDRSTVIQNVNVIYHIAANVNFGAKASASLRSNVLGTKEMLNLAQECKKLKVFVYVSTAYSHIYREDIYEEFYPSPTDLQTVYDMIEADEKTENGLSQELQALVGKFFSIYPYSKAIAEDLVRQHAKNARFALAIYRPSIVIAGYREPLAGWGGNIRAIIAFLFLAATLGFIRALYYLAQPVDLVPCDMAINALLVITRHAYVRRNEYERRELIYNYGSSTTNPIDCIALRDFSAVMSPMEKSSKAVALTITLTFTRNRWEFYLWHWTLHFIPALLIDFALLVSGRNPMILSIFWKVTRNLDSLVYFGNGKWKIHMPKTLEAIDKMSPADREIFYCDIRKLSWEEQNWIIVRGLKYHILKEEVTSEAGRRRYYLLCYIHYGFRMIWFIAFCYILFKLSSTICVN